VEVSVCVRRAIARRLRASERDEMRESDCDRGGGVALKPRSNQNQPPLPTHAAAGFATGVAAGFSAWGRVLAARAIGGAWWLIVFVG
jgi:hypothetical protein